MNNWQRNKNPITSRPYNAKEQAILTAAAMVKQQYPDTALFLGEREIEFKKKK